MWAWEDWSPKTSAISFQISDSAFSKTKAIANGRRGFECGLWRGVSAVARARICFEKRTSVGKRT